MDFFDRVKITAEERGIPLLKLLESVSFNYSSYKTLKRTGNLPRADEAYKIARALNVSVEYLLTGQETEQFVFLVKQLQAEMNSVFEQFLQSAENTKVSAELLLPGKQQD